MSEGPGRIYRSGETPSQKVPSTSRSYVVHGEVRPRSSPSHQAAPVPLEGELGHDVRSRQLSHYHPFVCQDRSPMVALEVSPQPRGIVGDSVSPVEIVFRRLSLGMGSIPGYEPGFGGLDSRGEPTSHQFSRVKGNWFGLRALDSSGQRQGSDSRGRQFDCLGLFKERGGDKIKGVVPSRPASPPLGRKESGISDNLLCSGVSKCYSGRPEQERGDSPQRVVPSSPDLRPDLGMVGRSSHRLICDQSQFQKASLCLSSGGSAGMESGRLFLRLASPGPLRLPSVPLYSASGKQTKAVQTDQDDPSGPLVAQATVVPRPDVNVFRQTQTPSNKTRHASAALRKGHAQGYFHSSSNRLATLERKYRARGFSILASRRMARSVKPSSSALYQCRWKIFRDWCLRHDLSAASTPISKVADFFIYLKDQRSLSLSAVKGYRAVVSSVQPWVGKNQYINTLFKAFNKDINKNICRQFSWNLDIVLKYLRSNKFEPLNSCSFINLTKKTLFLLALASAKRISELQALSKIVSFGKNSCILQYVEYFRAKTEAPDNPIPRSFKIQGLSTLAGNLEERLLCPVRALKFYCDRVENLRGSHDRLFCSVANPSRSLSKNALSFFLRTVIREAHEAFDMNDEAILKVKSHEVRAMSTSLAFYNNVSVERILNAANWKTNSVFASAYLKDLSTQYKDIIALGPIISAQVLID